MQQTLAFAPPMEMSSVEIESMASDGTEGRACEEVLGSFHCS